MSSKDSEDKKTISVYVDKDVAEALKKDFEGISSQIINNVSREFIEEVRRNPAMLYYLRQGDFSIVHRDKKAKAKD